ncbi:restriction endonuclease subunit S [Lactococcus raffinolactis]|uniref:restriction endonuclease subunit S n=1 Tax=Pseudolactococcus raffinolactis TaxID=1366 RepID=UPI0039A069E2
MMSKKSPQLRFEGFTDDWEERKLGDIAPLRGGFAFKSSEFRNNGVPIVRISNILSSGEVGGNFVYYDEQDKDDKYILPDKSAVLAMSGATTGKVSILSKTNDYKVYQNQRVGYFQSVEGIDYGFISTIVRSELFMKQLESVQASGAQPNVSSKEIDSFEFVIPKVFYEQQKIGSFFKQLDHTIALHQRKLDLLKEQKKGYLQKMFPKNGAKVPELRFAGFADDWEQRKLGDLATSFEYGLNASAKSFDGTHKYIRITDIDDSSRKFNSQSLTSPDIDLSSADNHKLKNGDILFARTGASVGKSYIYADSDGLVYYAGFLIRARIKSGVDSNFVFQHTLTSSYENFIRVTSQRSGQPGVNAKEYSTFEISVPSYEEQRKIGSFFKQLDDTITLHQRKLDLLKEQKKGLLQKMFV